jgi:hypothetical protein
MIADHIALEQLVIMFRIAKKDTEAEACVSCHYEGSVGRYLGGENEKESRADNELSCDELETI